MARRHSAELGTITRFQERRRWHALLESGHDRGEVECSATFTLVLHMVENMWAKSTPPYRDMALLDEILITLINPNKCFHRTYAKRYQSPLPRELPCFHALALHYLNVFGVVRDDAILCEILPEGGKCRHSLQ